MFWPGNAQILSIISLHTLDTLYIKKQIIFLWIIHFFHMHYRLVSVCYSTEASNSAKNITNRLIIEENVSTSSNRPFSCHVVICCYCNFCSKESVEYSVDCWSYALQYLSKCLCSTIQMLKAFAWLLKAISTAVSVLTWNVF